LIDSSAYIPIGRVKDYIVQVIAQFQKNCLIKFWENGWKVKIRPISTFQAYISGIFSDSRLNISIGKVSDYIVHVLAQFQKNCLIKFRENGQKVKIGPILTFRAYISGLLIDSRAYIPIGRVKDYIVQVTAQFQKNCLIKFWENGWKVKIGPISTFRAYISGIFSDSRSNISIGKVTDYIVHVLAQFQKNCLIKFRENGQKVKIGPISTFRAYISGLSSDSRVYIFIHSIKDPNRHVLK